MFAGHIGAVGVGAVGVGAVGVGAVGVGAVGVGAVGVGAVGVGEGVQPGLEQFGRVAPDSSTPVFVQRVVE